MRQPGGGASCVLVVAAGLNRHTAALRLPLHTRMLIGGGLGAVAGIVAHHFWAAQPWLDWGVRNIAQPAGQVFLRALLMLVVPLIFSALALGVAGMGEIRSLGRIGMRTLAYTVVASSMAVLLGLELVNTLRPGAGISEELRARLSAGATKSRVSRINRYFRLVVGIHHRCCGWRSDFLVHLNIWDPALGITVQFVCINRRIVAYIYLASGLPGSTQYLQSAGTGGVLALTLLGCGLGWGASWGWQKIQESK